MVDLLVEKILEDFERCNSDDLPEDLACFHCKYSVNGCYHSLHQDLIDAVKSLIIQYRFLSSSAEAVDNIKNLIGG